MSIQIHGKHYVTVDERVKAAHEACKKISISTEVLPIANKIVVKATVTTEKGSFTGISAANEAKLIEKQSPYEVAETSAVGRALGFAGYGVINGIATAEEIAKTKVQGSLGGSTPPITIQVQETKDKSSHFCKRHNTVLIDWGNGIWAHKRRLNERKEFDPTGDWYWCHGQGFQLSANQ
jgi:hypothetical protein